MSKSLKSSFYYFAECGIAVKAFEFTVQSKTIIDKFAAVGILQVIFILLYIPSKNQMVHCALHI